MSITLGGSVPMPADSSRAVFLSYASEDAAAARRIATALRAAGVEVWFDQNELVGGDAWDAKIRGQIAACALFVPVISAATQARLEGYFRIEWKLAAQRTHAMAEAKTFLLPVVVDATRDAEAHVPGEFRAVQWTRLPFGETPDKFCARVKQLLDGSTMEPGRPRSGESGEDSVSRVRVGVDRRGRWLGLGIAALAAVVAIVIWQPWHKTESSGSSNSTAATPAAAQTEALQLVARARELYSKMDYTRADLEAADEFARKATDREPALADAWGARAMVQAGYVVRGFVSGDERTRQSKEVQVLANRALVLQPDNPDALVALAKVLDGSVSESFLRRAVAAHPDHERALLALGEDLRYKLRLEEAQVIFDEAARRHPRSVGAHYDLAGNYMRMGNLAKAWEEIETALAIKPFMRGLLIKAYLAGVWRGDLPLMRATLESLAPADRTEDRAVYLTIWAALLEHEPKRALEAAAQTPRDYLVDSTGFFTGPKSMLVATAHRLAGNPNLARHQWQSAEVLLRRRLQQDPGNLEDAVMLATVLVWLGQETEAQSVVAPAEQAWREQLTQRKAQALAEYYAARGDAPPAAEYLRAALVGVSPSRLTRHALRLDPRWDRLRGQPSFVAVEREAAAFDGKVPRVPDRPATPDEKSVAVLAFANVGGDKENEIFSDGISEELINVLGRVPGLTVKGRASSFHFKGSTATAQEKGEKLGVAYLVDGSVRKMGNTVRITAQVSRAATDELVWAPAPLVRELKDIWAVQEEIAGLIAHALSLKLGVAQVPKAEVNPEVYRLYLKGRAAWRQRTAEGEKKAERLFQQALALDPDFARGHTGLADVWVTRAQRENSAGQLKNRNDALMDQLMARARRALQLDPSLAEAHTLLGSILWMDWKVENALRAHRAAVALNPNDATAQQRLGRAFLTDGRMDEALEALRRAHELDPLFARIADNNSVALIAARRLEEAVVMANRALVLQPESRQALAYKTVALAELGQTERAIAAARLYTAGTGPLEQDATPSMVAYALARVNESREADLLLARVPEGKREGAGAAALLLLGRREEALTVLRAGNSNASGVDIVLWWPVFDAVREAPEFKTMISAMGLTAAHERAQAWRKAHPAEKGAGKR